jgi:hypothetical protein
VCLCNLCSCHFRPLSAVLPQVGAVVVGFDRNVNYYKLQYATLCIRENPGCLFIATNTDAVTHLTDAQVRIAPPLLTHVLTCALAWRLRVCTAQFLTAHESCMCRVAPCIESSCGLMSVPPWYPVRLACHNIKVHLFRGHHGRVRHQRFNRWPGLVTCC